MWCYFKQTNIWSSLSTMQGGQNVNDNKILQLYPLVHRLELPALRHSSMSYHIKPAPYYIKGCDWPAFSFWMGGKWSWMGGTPDPFHKVNLFTKWMMGLVYQACSYTLQFLQFFLWKFNSAVLLFSFLLTVLHVFLREEKRGVRVDVGIGAGVCFFWRMCLLCKRQQYSPQYPSLTALLTML